MTRLKEQYKQGEITLDQALAEIAKGNRGLRRSKTARYFNKIKKKQTKPAKKVKQVDVEIKKDLKPLTLKQCMKARTEFEPMPAMTPEKQTTLLGRMDQWIKNLKAKRKQAN